MSIMKYIKQMRRIDSLIRRKSTGTADELAEKMNLSRSSLMEYIQEMRMPGFPIGYDRKHRHFYYEKEGRMTTNLFEEPLSGEEMKKAKGGSARIRDVIRTRK